jgi:hypothetical protein
MNDDTEDLSAELHDNKSGDEQSHRKQQGASISDDTEDLSVEPAYYNEAPNYPTLDYSRANPEMLKKTPSRWKRNAVVIAGIAGAVIIGGVSFVRCGIRFLEDLDNHHGGAGGGLPDYFTYHTEQEVFGYIRSQAGLEELDL